MKNVQAQHSADQRKKSLESGSTMLIITGMQLDELLMLAWLVFAKCPAIFSHQHLLPPLA